MKNYVLLAVLITTIFIFGIDCKKESEHPMSVQEPVVAGKFYPDDKIALRDTISELFNSTPSIPMGSNLFGIISPHAGYVFSGPIAAYAYKNLPKNEFNCPRCSFTRQERVSRAIK